MMTKVELAEAEAMPRIDPCEWTSLDEHQAGRCKVAPNGQIRCLYCHGFGKFNIEFCVHNVVSVLPCLECEKLFSKT